MPIVPFERFVSASFDYLILGGGTAGLALASRLSEDDNLTIGVLEAGGVPADIAEINVPALMGRTIANPTYDWTFLSVPQAHANGRTVLQPRGKGLGGSSIINFMGLFRPSKIEYDALEGLGGTGWNWENLLGYMKKGENTFPSGLSPEDAKKYAASPKSIYHGINGPLQKSLPLGVPPQLALLFDSAAELGVPRKNEMGDGTNIGSMSCFSSIDPRSAQRSSSFSAYFLPVESRPNLLVLTGAQVTKILFENEPAGLQRAVGAHFMHEGKQASITGVKKDVIVSAGALQTPHLLELSGVGNQTILKKHGIKPLIHLPGVGENLQEHPCVATIVEIDSKYQTMDELADPGKMEIHQELYKQQKGLLASIPAVGFLFLAAKHLGIAGDAVSFHSAPEPAEPSLQRGLHKQYKLQKEWLTGEEVAQAEIIYHNGHQRRPTPLPVPGRRYASFVHAVMHPLSRGSVHLSSADPLVPPAIDPNYLADPADLEFLTKAVNFSTRLVHTGPFGEIVKGHVVPDQETLADSRRLREWIKESVVSTFHPIGTAAMLPREDGGVVGAELRVYGTTNLRVVDVSVLPMQLSCHIQSAAYAIAEKAADILKNGSKF